MTATCDVCGNVYDKPIQVSLEGRTMTFDSFECAITRWRRPARIAAARSSATASKPAVRSTVVRIAPNTRAV